MATTNLLQWNPTGANQENDAAYLADSQRAGGAANPAIFQSILANKVFYQLSTYLTALFQAAANKGYTTSDSSINTLTSVCANFVMDSDLPSNVEVISYAATQTLNASLNNGFYLAGLTGNTSIAAMTNLSAGQTIVMSYQQDGTGGRVVTFPSAFVGAVTPDPAPNAVSLQVFNYDSVTGFLRATSPLISTNGAFFPANVGIAGYGFATTPPTSDNSTKIATTAWNFLGFSASLGVNGYLQLPTWLSGLVLQWGYLAGTNGTFNFPVAFPNACFNIQACRSNATSGAAADTPIAAINSASQFYLATVDSLNGTRSGFPCWWFAVGN